MAKSKKSFYAVIRGVKPGVYDNEEEAYKQVYKFPKGYSKRFKSLEEATEYYNNEIKMGGNGTITEAKRQALNFEGKSNQDFARKNMSLILYTDGSYTKNMSPATVVGSYVSVIDSLHARSIMGSIAKNLKDDEVKQGSAIAEAMAIIQGLGDAYSRGHEWVTIAYDFELIPKIFDGTATFNSSSNVNVMKPYIEKFNHYSEKMRIDFEKVDGHAGNVYNHLAHRLNVIQIANLKDEYDVTMEVADETMEIAQNEFWHVRRTV